MASLCDSFAGHRRALLACAATGRQKTKAGRARTLGKGSTPSQREHDSRRPAVAEIEARHGQASATNRL